MKSLRQIVGTPRLALLILACLIFGSRVRAQFGTLVCGVGEPAATDQAGDGERAQDCGYDGADWILKYRTPQHWTPTSITPMKTIAVNLVICRDANGLNGWEDTPVLRDELDALFDSINYRYSHSQVKGYTMTCEPTINYIVDTKVRFRLNELYFVDNTAFNLAYGEGWGAAVGAQDVLDWLWATYPDTRNQMNHILTMPAWDDGVSYAGYSPPSPYQGHTYVHSINQMLDDWPFYINHYCHEYAHLIGLHHVYNSEYKQLNHYDYLDDVFGQCHEPLTSDVNNPCFANCGQPNQPCACTEIAGQVCYLNTCNFFQFFPDPKPLMGNSPKIRYISPKSAGRMHRALSIYNYTFRLNNRPTHQYVDEKYSYVVPYTVSTNETWDFGMKLYQDLVISAGTTLTLTCELRMPIGGKIIVQQGGKLIVDGGVITCAHTGQFWQGIEAWGTTNQHQYPANQPTYQGLVVLKNGALVEHALVGFTNWRPGVKASRGGVLQVQGTLNGTGGTFLNCRRGVEFKKYRNFHPSNPSLTQNNLSYFWHGDFIVDPDYRGGDDFDHHVDLWDVTGIAFTQCDFINTQVSGPGGINESHKLGTGIFSLDATYSVFGQCAISLPLCEYGSGLPQPVCPEQDLRRSRFLGLDHGIHATSSGMASRTFTVRDSHFENNICGIFSEGVDNAAMLRNTFVVGGRDVTDLTGLDAFFDGMHRAVYTHHANAFRVEENHLQPAGTPLVDVEGVVVGSTNAYNDQVYKNFSNGMYYGFVAENDCVDGSDPVSTGLSLLCNQNNGNQEEDFKLRSSTTPELDHCIKMFQGSTSKSAGNTFTPAQTGSSPYYNYHNGPEQLPITYFWQAAPGDLSPGAYNTPWVQRHNNISPANSCPTRITCGGGPQVKASLQPLMDDEQLAYLNLKYVYESLLDGGDFEELKETIMESWPQDAWELRNTLMEKSPYLSVEILKEAGMKNILPHALYLEVCLANPEGTQRSGFVKWVQYEMPNPLPEYMVAQVVASWDQKTWRTSLESAMGWHQGEYQRLNDQVIGAMLNDTVPEPPDSVRVRWQLNTTLRARYAESATLLEQGNYTAAEALLAGLDATYKMGIAELQERDDMLALITVVRNASVADRSIMELDNVEVAALEAIAAHQPSRAATHARGILCFGYGICAPPITGGAAQPKSRWTQPRTTGTNAPSFLSVHPNPASTWVAFSHTITGPVDRAFIRVRDAQGKEVYSAPIATSPGQSIWDTRGVVAGTYMVELHNKATLVETQRVVVRP